jgi:hypothetical protein
LLALVTTCTSHPSIFIISIKEVYNSNHTAISTLIIE